MKTLVLFYLLMSAAFLSAADSQKQFKVAERTFEVPSTWTAVTPSSKMRKAQFKAGSVE